MKAEGEEGLRPPMTKDRMAFEGENTSSISPSGSASKSAPSGSEPSAGFTPGRWFLSPCDEGILICAPDNGDVDDPWNVALAYAACGYPDDPRSGHTEANARLIAAAPDQHDELVWIAAFAEMRSNDDSATFARVNRAALRTIAERARVAITKALGPSAQDTSERSVPARDTVQSDPPQTPGSGQ